MRYLSSYKIRVTYSDGHEEEITLAMDGSLNWAPLPEKVSAIPWDNIIRLVWNVTNWLKRNGGTKIELEEE